MAFPVPPEITPKDTVVKSCKCPFCDGDAEVRITAKAGAYFMCPNLYTDPDTGKTGACNSRAFAGRPPSAMIIRKFVNNARHPEPEVKENSDDIKEEPQTEPATGGTYFGRF